MWDDFIDTFITPLIPTIRAMWEHLPQEERPTWSEMYGVGGTGFTYIGLNLLLSPDVGCDNVTFEGTYNPQTREHYGICVHRDKNNARRKLGIIITLGCFKGFGQFMLPWGVQIDAGHMSLLWVDDSDILHAVLPGVGTRMSIVLFNHEWVETGVRRDDLKQIHPALLRELGITPPPSSKH